VVVAGKSAVGVIYNLMRLLVELKILIASAVYLAGVMIVFIYLSFKKSSSQAIIVAFIWPLHPIISYLKGISAIKCKHKWSRWHQVSEIKGERYCFVCGKTEKRWKA
jgi:hypothetical protein